ncbi:MAG: hypothetical protein LBQ54_01010 [Planctomycetaceae bacterium]|nr:hypothetical protein [Planctomycetaceae bacterium]
MLKYTLLFSAGIYSGVMLLLGLIAAAAVTVMKPVGFTWPMLVTALCGVFVAGIISLTVIFFVQKHSRNGVISTLAGTMSRLLIIGMVIITVIVTQEKNFVFYMLLFSIVFYFGVIGVNVWLTMPRQWTGVCRTDGTQN